MFQMATNQHNDPTIYQNQPAQVQKYEGSQKYQNYPVK